MQNNQVRDLLKYDFLNLVSILNHLYVSLVEFYFAIDSTINILPQFYMVIKVFFLFEELRFSETKIISMQY